MTEERERPPLEPTLTLDDVAAALRVSTKTVLKLCHTGALKFQRVGNRYRFRKSWVEAYLDSND